MQEKGLVAVSTAALVTVTTVLAVVLAAVLAVAVWRRWAPWGLLVAAAATLLTVAWSAMAATRPVIGANMWPVGAAGLFALSMLVGTILAMLLRELQAYLDRRHDTQDRQQPSGTR